MVKLTKISEGSEADIYKYNLFGLDCIIKYRRKKNYLIDNIDEMLRLKRTKKEAKIIIHANNNKIRVPSVLLVGKYSIYMEYINGISLNQMGSDKFNKKMFFNIGELLKKIHSNGIVHNDFTIANLILYKNLIYVIDFGLSEFSTADEERAIDLLLMKNSINKNFYDEFIKGYKKSNTFFKQVFSKLENIEKRGRYQIRTLETKER